MKTLKVLSVVAATALMLAGCTGPKGDPGATGPQGPQGNANVSETTYTIYSWSWSSPQYYAALTIPSLTQNIQDYGSVTAFISIDNGLTWNSIPTTTVDPSENAYWSLATQTGLAQISFEWQSKLADGDPNATWATSTLAKVVCVASGVMKKHPNTNWNNYYQVESVVSQENGARITK